MPLVTLPEAAALLRRGGLVAVPTETVYGLAADATNEAAVRAIFATKGRPAGHPLILHARDPRPYAAFDERAERLAAFWPGPLTLVLPLRPGAGVAPAVSGGHGTLAVRCPAHPLTLALLDAAGVPLAAPSANRFGEVSPTTAEHVLRSFPDLPVLDGGPCTVGVESTIVDLSGPVPSLLRPGGVPAEALTLVLGDLAPAGTTAAPGTLPAHYAPRARVIVVDAAGALPAELRAAGETVTVLPRLPPAEHARTLYASLRAADDAGATVIVCERAAASGLGAAINDRLQRAAFGR